jgi:hypothetical protein
MVSLLIALMLALGLPSDSLGGESALQWIPQRLEIAQTAKPLLLPANGCALPCLLGIQLEEIDRAQVALTHATHPWSYGARGLAWSYGSDRWSMYLETHVAWWWNGRQPSWLGRGTLYDIGRYDYLRFSTRMTVLDTWLALGMPDGGYFVPSYGSRNKFCGRSLYEAHYGKQLLVRAWVDQPVTPASFWFAEVDVQFDVYHHNAAIMRLRDDRCEDLRP